MDRFLRGVERRAYRMAQIATGNREDALEIVQDAMLKLVQRYASRREHEWGPLFHRILQSRIQDWYRRTRVRQRWLGWLGGREEEDEDPIQCARDPNGSGPMEHLEGEQLAESLERALNRLPLRQQQTFLLRAWEGFDVAETASVMGLSVGSVKTHYSRALQNLRDHLEEHRL